MSLLSVPRRRLWIVGAVVLLVGVSLAGYLSWNTSRLPGPGSPLYEQYVEAFQVGVAALDADVPQIGGENLSRAIELIPEEPAAWANRGLLNLWTSRLDEAARDLDVAFRLSPQSPGVLKLLGLLEQRRGQFSAAAAHLREAVKNSPQDIEILYLLAQVVDQEQQEGSDAEHQRLLEQILIVRPGNVFVLSELLLIEARRSDRPALNATLQRLEELAPSWSERSRAALVSLRQALGKSAGAGVVPELLTFSNVLRAESGYIRMAGEVNPQSPQGGSSLHSFLRLTPVRHAPAPPDLELTFEPEPLKSASAGPWNTALPVWLNGEGRPTLIVASSEEVRRVDAKSALAEMPVARNGVLAFDWNNDFQTDLLIVGKRGLRFLRQGKAEEFVDVTAETGLSAEIRQGDYYGAFAADFDLDGDLDVLLALQLGRPFLLRNNFDSTFTPQKTCSEVTQLRGYASADFDHDGAPDAALLDGGGNLHIFANERSGRFQKWPVTVLQDNSFRAIAVADANDDGVLDLVALQNGGRVVCIADRDHRGSWEITELAQWEPGPIGYEPHQLQLLAADLDNNGVLDLLASGPEGSAAWLGEGGGKFRKLPADLPAQLLAAADLRDTGHVDLLGLDASGQPFQLRNVGQKNYHWQKIRPRAVIGREAAGDNRINSFGIGGEIELRSGTHVVKQPIASPVVHFGLGERPRADVIRLLWPNGTFQVEFQSPVDQTIVAQQRLKGSCPFLFTWNGQGFGFVTDFMWSTPLGMYINAADKGGFLQTTDWVKIGGDQLVPRDGAYEVRINANLWETHFFDHMALLAVDHPQDTEMFVDERFFFEVAEPAFHLMQKPRPVAHAWDHHGRDANDEIRAVDGLYLDRARRGIYQGVAEDHWVEVELGDVSSGSERQTAIDQDQKQPPGENRPLWLIARGWVHPTDSSVNYALEQGRHEKPRGLVLEVPDGKGSWKVARDRLGFPAGKHKTVLIRLDGIDGPGVPPRFRLRTSMEIYWDAIQFARGVDDSQAVKQTLQPVQADLRFRGILAMSQANRSSPELPDYVQIVNRGQHWRDLIGYHTRYGDIRELLQKVDDRYAILCGGDEVVLQFTVPAAVPAGWKRDFIWVCDGWVKDGDLNTRFGKTVLPLPSHDLKSYDTPPGRLEDDPVYRRHSHDWEVFHTRYVTPQNYEQGLRNFRVPRAEATGRDR
ncbi:MAG: Tetratricopeptide repeat protein [Planctomycetaceae bacterium]|nr:Tetratricopeptide repeat protein [Planctomycetaceae bacterium]